MKGLFSERNGYDKPSDVLIIERLTQEMINCICTCFDDLREDLNKSTIFNYMDLEEYLWIYFLHNRKNNFIKEDIYGKQYKIVATEYLQSKVEWFKKFDIVEATIKYLFKLTEKHPQTAFLQKATAKFITQLNYFFNDLNYGYHVIDGLIVPVTSEGEIKTIEEAIDMSDDNVKMHFHCALEKLSERPKGDYRNSIKESISAVEAYCRNRTGKDSLGNALAEMEHNGLCLPVSLKGAFLKLYGYTNSPETGIRHPLMDVDGNYVPTADEAVYMLISCSAFINYLRKKEI